jgi:2-polyprenyl-3-methyl-5-hydroxy-6-metoxy-1,4-benzoquinol methylase
MIKICQSTYPKATYFQGDFLDYTPAATSPEEAPAHRAESAGAFDAVVFNESLHHFQQTDRALAKALSLTRPGGKIIISHPRGFDNVFLQQRKNKWLTPSLLPSDTDLAALAAPLGAVVTLPPKTKSAHYLAILTKN